MPGFHRRSGMALALLVCGAASAAEPPPPGRLAGSAAALSPLVNERRAGPIAAEKAVTSTTPPLKSLPLAASQAAPGGPLAAKAASPAAQPPALGQVAAIRRARAAHMANAIRVTQNTGSGPRIEAPSAEAASGVATFQNDAARAAPAPQRPMATPAASTMKTAANNPAAATVQPPKPVAAPPTSASTTRTTSRPPSLSQSGVVIRRPSMIIRPSALQEPARLSAPPTVQPPKSDGGRS